MGVVGGSRFRRAAGLSPGASSSLIARAQISVHAVTAADLSYFYANVRQRSTSNMVSPPPPTAIVTVAMEEEDLLFASDEMDTDV